jgi:hypothetical protein
VSALHPDLSHVVGLVGTWSGRGSGRYPTIAPFDYFESITFGHVGKPFLSYSQRTRSLGAPGEPARPMHAESGFWRFPSPGCVEVVLSHPTGVTEIDEGSIEIALDGTIVIELASVAIGLTSSAKPVAGLERTFRVDGDVIEYEVRMAAVGLPLQHHLAARLEREPG